MKAVTLCLLLVLVAICCGRSVRAHQFEFPSWSSLKESSTKLFDTVLDKSYDKAVDVVTNETDRKDTFNSLKSNINSWMGSLLGRPNGLQNPNRNVEVMGRAKRTSQSTTTTSSGTKDTKETKSSNWFKEVLMGLKGGKKDDKDGKNKQDTVKKPQPDDAGDTDS